MAIRKIKSNPIVAGSIKRKQGEKPWANYMYPLVEETMEIVKQ